MTYWLLRHATLRDGSHASDCSAGNDVKPALLCMHRELMLSVIAPDQQLRRFRKLLNKEISAKDEVNIIEYFRQIIEKLMNMKRFTFCKPVITEAALHNFESVAAAGDAVVVFRDSAYTHERSLFLSLVLGLVLFLRFHYNMFQQNFQQIIVFFYEIIVHMYIFIDILLPVIFEFLRNWVTNFYWNWLTNFCCSIV